MIKNLILIAASFFPFNTVFAEGNLSAFGFVDSYLATSDNNVEQERPYFTQVPQNDEYRLNLATIGIGYDDASIRGKFSGQFGDSVNNNYYAEPEEFFKYIQESFVGLYLDEGTYLDAGTFLAHIGAESWLSKDNLNYTRSYIAEFSPYYETGLRLSHKINDRWSMQILGVNGWQNTTDNRHPALGTQLSYSKEDLILTSNTFVGKENYGSRLFHNFIATNKFKGGASVTGSIDIGHQSERNSGYWWGYSVMAKQELNDALSLNARFESFMDPDLIVVSTETGEKFNAYGSSIGADFILSEGLLLRGEVKWLWSENEIFNNGSYPDKKDTLYVLSLSYFKNLI